MFRHCRELLRKPMALAAGRTGRAGLMLSNTPRNNSAMYSFSRKILSSYSRKIMVCSVARKSAHPKKIILGIETSFDDTGVALISSTGRILGEARITQGKEHLNTGGTVPVTAGLLHKERLPDAVESTFKQAGMKLHDIDAVACTIGPGLAPCLDAGLSYAKYLCMEGEKPLIPVHHMEAHALTARMTQSLEFPFLVLLVSGGHSLLLRADGVGSFQQLGTTADDAPGEALDKVARALGVRGGGRGMEDLCRCDLPDVPEFPTFTVPLSGIRNCDFSFSGLKTAAFRRIEQHCKAFLSAATREEGPRSTAITGAERHELLMGLQSKQARKYEITARILSLPENQRMQKSIATAFQDAVFTHIVDRTHRALIFSDNKNIGKKISGLVVSGGVACNTDLRTRLTLLASAYDVPMVVPEQRLCVDNGVMIAWTGLEYFNENKDLVADADAIQAMRYIPKWALGVDARQDVQMANIKLPKRGDFKRAAAGSGGKRSTAPCTKSNVSHFK
eukprot:m.698453 g.698453  ORF g.698453 m.698453 type:complete len:505 (+) comp22901_c1_seq5:412-1926(+)